jgi:dihydropteroate synthase
MRKLVLKDKIFNLDKKAVIMGILNITPDSFSDGNQFYCKDSALAQAELMINEGVDIIDIGGESSRPGAAAVSLQEELDRVMPIIEIIKKEFAIPVSIDTCKSGVAALAATYGVEMLNDITALQYDAKMADVAAENNLAICLMHIRGTPDNMQINTIYTDLVTEVIDKLKQTANICLQKGISKESIILDPGIGFGKSVEGNLQLLKKLSELKKLGFSVLIGTSRKSFIGKVLDVEVNDRLNGTIASNVVALMNGADVFRVHDVKAHRQALDLAKAIINS